MKALEKMAGHPRLYRRGAVYYHRAAVPKDIAGTYPKVEETFSLKTKDYSEALRRVRVASVEVDQRFEAHRRHLEVLSQPALPTLTPEQIAQVKSVYYQHLLEEDEEVRLDGFRESDARPFTKLENFSRIDPRPTFEGREELIDKIDETNRRNIARGQQGNFLRGEAEEVLSWEGVELRLAPDSITWPRLVKALQEATIQAAEDIRSRNQGNVVETPIRPETEMVNEPSAGPLLSKLFEERKSEASRTNKWSPKLVDDYQTWTDLFLELAGDRPILSYKKPDARDFKNKLMELPSNRNKHKLTKDLPLLDAIKVAKANNLARVSVSTINKALGRMQATWKWADKQLDETVDDIFGPMKIESNVSARDEADPFSLEQLKALFNSPVFTGCLSSRFRAEPGVTDMRHTSWYWLPLLGLFTGARLNELCQLRLNDLGEEKGIAFLRLHEGEETQRIKGNKKRNVPLHPELIRLGFLNYANEQRRAGAERVFPSLTVDAKGYYSNKPSKDFGAYIEKLGIKTPKTSFHSFRHNFKDACRRAGVSSDVNDILLGHALFGMGARYGDGKIPVPQLFEAVSKIEYEGLSLGHLRSFGTRT